MTDDELAAIDPSNTPTADERTLLVGFLDYYRAVLARKAQGLSKEQLAVRLGPSDLTLGGLVKHMAIVEDIWFHERLHGRERLEPFASAPWDDDPDWEIHSAADDEPGEIFALYDAACKRSRAAIDGVDLDAPLARPNRLGLHFSLRWVLIHMIEEYARHAGHADLIRQSIDGATGD